MKKVAVKVLSRAARLEEVMNQLDSDIQSAIDDAKMTAQDGINELKDEIESWKSNLEGTNLENSSKYQDLEQCVSDLEDLESEVDNIDSSVVSNEIPDSSNISFPGMY